MLAHALRITAIIAFIVLCTLLPFLPGEYDSLAMPLSVMAQVVGVVGLLLVPIGVLWIVFEYRNPSGRKRFWFAVAALIAASLAWLAASLMAITASLTLGLAALGMAIFGLMKLVPRIRGLTGAAATPRSAIPLYLIVVPVAVALTQRAVADPMAAFSRGRAIRNSAELIADLEAHRVANGRYPPSTMALLPDYKPAVIGIREYRYEPSGESYNVFFEQPTFRFGTQEIVMYNPRDEQAIAAHAMDVIRMTPAQLALDRQRGHYAVHDTPHPHWRYFWFD